MTKELKPCPFCGNEPVVEAESCCAETGYSVRCIYRDCKVSPSTYLHETKKQAIEAWNNRAGRTCQAEYRTGGNEFGAFYCSACDNYMDKNDRYFGNINRIAKLEDLCRDMYKMLAFALDGEPGELASQADLAKSIHDRMVSYDLMLDEWKRSE